MYIHKNIFQHFLAWAQLCLNPRVLFQFLNDSRLGKNLGAEGDWKIANPRANRHAHSSTRIAFFVENGSHQWLLHESAIYICMRPASFQIQKYEGAFFYEKCMHITRQYAHMACCLLPDNRSARSQWRSRGRCTTWADNFRRSFFPNRQWSDPVLQQKFFDFWCWTFY